jgi:hypothetical protein
MKRTGISAGPLSKPMIAEMRVLRRDDRRIDDRFACSGRAGSEPVLVGSCEMIRAANHVDY